MTRSIVVAAALLLAGSVARAQTGLCSGMMAGEARLAIADAGGTFHTVAASATPTLFGGAECACDTHDVHLEIALTEFLPSAISGIAEVWVGDSSCANAATRTSTANTTCEKIAAPSIQDFTVNSNSNGTIEVPLPARALFSPLSHDCSALPLAANGVYVFIYTDPFNPLATCSLSLSERSQPPSAPVDVSAAWQGDGSVMVSWTAPDGSPAPVAYDVLCTTDDGAPVAGPAASADFSQCTPGGLERRQLPAGDGTVIVGAAAAASGGDALSPPRAAAVCAHVDGQGRATTIAGLAAAAHHRFAVVAADAFGNSAVSDAVALDPAPTPTPTLTPAHGGCSVGGRGSVTPSALIALGAALWLAVSRRPLVSRRARRRQ